MSLEPTYISHDVLRGQFSSALSSMYRSEVPLYGELVNLCQEINDETNSRDLIAPWTCTGASEKLILLILTCRYSDRLMVERHGAIRLGKPSELATCARLFRQMGMFPVGYYDLTTSGLPVHATAFRPRTQEALKRNPFRLFTSLLRLELITDGDLRAQVEKVWNMLGS